MGDMVRALSVSLSAPNSTRGAMLCALNAEWTCRRYQGSRLARYVATLARRVGTMNTRTSTSAGST